ncbi:MAG: hypothetical protein KY428_04790 [Bacteroidetes bacterium]|nr:hypothetical protein [Bacteroidota bacterium]
MKHWHSFFLLLVQLCLFAIPAALAQDYAATLKDPGKDLAKRCKDPLLVLKTLPPEARYSTHIQDGIIYILFSDPAVFQQLIRGDKDGFAIDLVHKDQFSCGTAQASPSSKFRGQLQEPLYKAALSRRTTQDEGGNLWVHMGSLPPNMAEEDVEPNLVLIHKRYVCHYLSIYDLDMQDWGLLETGLYRDTLSYSGHRQTSTKALTKTLHFTIPFEKNRADYRQQDIQALYDSLKLTDYNITGLRILAYTSVEGSLERNLRLQQRRAENLVKALEDFQGLPVKASIRTSENWVEFLEDLNHTPHRDLATLSKQEIKEKLKDPKLSASLEPYLKRHRKGLVSLKLQKKVSYFQESPQNIKRYYDQSIQEENIAKALQLQEVIFERIKHESLPSTFLDQLEVPRQTLFGPLLIEQAAFAYTYLQQDELSTLHTIEELQRLLPDNEKVAYNIAVLKLKVWSHTPSIAESLELKRSIIALRKKNIPDALVNRLLINYYIIETQRQLFARNYREKDKNLQLIYNAYKGLVLDDADVVRLASFFAFYSRFDWSRTVLQTRVKKLDVSEDVIFYYLNLTAADPRYTKNKDFRQILNNAYNSNPLRYCNMFGTRGFGGISFQLLQDAYLKQTYCDNCSDTTTNP